MTEPQTEPTIEEPAEDWLEQREPVVPGQPSEEPAPAGDPTTPLPDDADEADVVEQRAELSVDDEEDYPETGSPEES